MDDREVVAAIASGDPAGIAVAYDRYAAGLFGYCQWMLHQPADAAEAVRDTFVVAATLGDLPEAPKLRPWLYAVARNECLRRNRITPASPAEHAEPAEHPGAAGHGAEPADEPAEVIDPEQAELREQVQAVLAELEPDEREVIELSLRHDLYDNDLATALGVPWSQAYALLSRARSQLEKDLGALLVARAKREDCPALGALLAGWDDQLTGETRDRVAGHIERCGTCAAYRRGTLRPAALAGLQPLPGPPAGLRDEVMKLCSPTTPETPMYRRSAERGRPASFSEAIRALRWENIRSNPGAAIAAGAVLLWVVAVVGVALLTLAGSHSAQALAPSPSASARATSPAATAGPIPASTRTSAAVRPSPAGSRTAAGLGPAAGRSATPTGSAGQLPGSQSPTPSTSSSAKPSKSPSPGPSTSPSPAASGPSPASPSPSKSA